MIGGHFVKVLLLGLFHPTLATLTTLTILATFATHIPFAKEIELRTILIHICIRCQPVAMDGNKIYRCVQSAI